MGTMGMTKRCSLWLKQLWTTSSQTANQNGALGALPHTPDAQGKRSKQQKGNIISEVPSEECVYVCVCVCVYMCVVSVCMYT